MSKKIYVIGEERTTFDTSPRPVARPPAARGGAPGAPSRPAERAAATPASPVVLLLAYLTGPFGLLATGRGWASAPWRIVAIASGLAWIAGAATWHLVPGWLALHPAMCVVWPVVTLLSASIGSIAWARGVRWAQEEVHLGRLAGVMRHPLTGGLLGFLIPGLAHTMTSQSKRAVAILALSGPLAASILVVLQARHLWRTNHSSPSPALSDGRLEAALIAFGVTAAVAALAWLVQAVDGVRVASRLRGSHASWVEGLAMLLLVSAVGLTAIQHERIASELDQAAGRFRSAGFESVPLWLWSGAAFLDASEPVYALRTAELHRERGNEIEADRIRRDLERRWEAYRSELAGSTGTSSGMPTVVAEHPGDRLIDPDSVAGELVF